MPQRHRNTAYPSMAGIGASVARWLYFEFYKMKKLLNNILLVNLLLLLAILVSCEKNDSDDVTPATPTCEIITPDDSSTIQQGIILRIEVMLSGFGEDARVRFTVDSIQVSETLGAPYEFMFDTEGWAIGMHTIKTEAYEAFTLASDEIIIILIDTIVPPQTPVPVISIVPESGNTDTIFSFDASGSYDYEDPFEDLLFRWDFDGDGSWDTDFTDEVIFFHKYTHPSNYQVKLEVIDSDGMTADTIYALLVIHSGSPDACEGYVSIPYGGQVYHTVAIGDQCWFRENLNIGEMINGVAQSDNEVFEKYCYNNDSANCEKYGGLYQWKEMMDYFPLQGTQGICPNGWHIPIDDDWKELEGYADTQYGVGDPIWDENSFRGFDAGKHLKSLLGWNSGGNGDNLFDFKALPAGFWESGFAFNSETEEAHFWSSTHDNGLNAASRMLKFDTDKISRSFRWDEAAFSVRCIKD